MLKLSAFLFALGLLMGCVSGQQQREIVRGQKLASANCTTCHAIGAVGESPAPEAPPFRTLSRNYRVADLEEALAEGISVGHPAMPQFAFGADDAHALVVYLQSIQEQHPDPRAPS
jgi:mono/diheme cytochrome c family protein